MGSSFMSNPDSPVMVDGSISWEAGVNSIKPTTIASAHNPGGLARNELAWLVNGTVRNGGISPRSGWQPIFKIEDWTPQMAAMGSYNGYQGGFLYDPSGSNKAPTVTGANTVTLKTIANPSAVATMVPFAPQPLFPPGIASSFAIPAVGATVVATTVLPYGGSIGQQFNFVGSGTLIFEVTAFTSQVITPAPVVGLGTPYLIASIGGQIWMADPNGAGPVNLSTLSGLSNPPNVEHAYFCQGESFLVIQAGDGVTLPLFWDGVTLRRSKGLPGSELPAAYAMVYYMQRIWYAYGDLKTYVAGDIVGNKFSGTAAYNFTDSILKVTENPLAIGGDGFRLPSNAGNIRALAYPNNINASLGQGQLYIFTRKQVYALTVPVSRADWIAANSNNQPLQTVVQITNGSTGDRSIAAISGDLYYQTLQPAVASLVNAVRYFQQPGNIPISAPENRIIQYDDRSLLSLATGIEFDNRLIESALPKRLPQGVVHSAVLPLDFEPVSQPGSGAIPVWEGHLEGLDILQMFVGDFGGLQRAFALVVSRNDGSYFLWEITQRSLTENGDNRIVWQIETPAFTFGTEFELKKLVAGELWFDRLSGTAEIFVEYRTDGQACWTKWHAFKECSARDCLELIPPCLPPTYPPPPALGQGYRDSITLPKPPESCDFQMGRPSTIGHQFQLRITIHGSLRMRGIFIHGTKVERKLYAKLTC